MTSPRVGTFVDLAADPVAVNWQLHTLSDVEITGLAPAFRSAHAQALTHTVERIHPTAIIHPAAIIGDDVLIGPHARVHEFSTVRDGSVVSGHAVVGHGCEVIHTLVGWHAILTHRVVIGHSIVGAHAHLAAGVIVASVHLWNADMACPDREITIRAPGGHRYDCGAVKFGAVIGDRVRIGVNTAVGPGVLIGPDALLYSGVTASQTVLPAHAVVRPLTAIGVQIEPRRPLSMSHATVHV
ncbi:hypothetical protein [Frankia sp. Cr2]|uniref:hypothetical protein n=1 Tax=Frankia sp. Cr2 TaxID=3073932 RepID=UPI002AD46D51|nr:hypothetical protein [Frankia sp. Cr2]